MNMCSFHISGLTRRKAVKYWGENSEENDAAQVLQKHASWGSAQAPEALNSKTLTVGRHCF